jgi:GNAT superfamily N-acetyltransferase
MGANVDALEMVRVATPAHWAEYHRIRRAVLFEARGRPETYDESHPDDRASANHPFLLTANGVPVAVVRVDLGAELQTAVFRRLAVSEPLQRRGYGRALMQRAESFAEGEGFRRFVAYVAPDAVEFWSKLGYRMASHQVTGNDPRMEKEWHMVFALDTDDGGLMAFASTAEAVLHCKGIDVQDGFWRFFAEDGSPLEARFERLAEPGNDPIVCGSYTLQRAMSGLWLQERLDQIVTVRGCGLNTVAELAETLKGNRGKRAARESTRGGKV